MELLPNQALPCFVFLSACAHVDTTSPVEKDRLRMYLVERSLVDPAFGGHPCPNDNNVRAPRTFADQSIHAQTIITFVFQEHSITRAAMPKPL